MCFTPSKTGTAGRAYVGFITPWEVAPGVTLLLWLLCWGCALSRLHAVYVQNDEEGGVNVVSGGQTRRA